MVATIQYKYHVLTSVWPTQYYSYVLFSIFKIYYDYSQWCFCNILFDTFTVKFIFYICTGLSISEWLSYPAGRPDRGELHPEGHAGRVRRVQETRDYITQ